MKLINTNNTNTQYKYTPEKDWLPVLMGKNHALGKVESLIVFFDPRFFLMMRNFFLRSLFLWPESLAYREKGKRLPHYLRLKSEKGKQK
jgi:hypothetical protein